MTGIPKPGLAVTISTALLLPGERIPRLPLERWASRLATDLDQTRKTARRIRVLAREVAVLANNTALVATVQGQRGVARQQCEQQVNWHHRLGRRSRDPGLCGHAVQPWVNIGRLESLSGDWRASLNRFAHLNAYRTTDELRLGKVRIGRTGWEAVAASRTEFQQMLDAINVIDSLKTLLTNGRFEDVLTFTSRLGTQFGEILLRRSDEAMIVARCRLGDFEGACDLATAAAKQVRGWERAVFGVRLGEVLACAGDHRRAASLLGSVSATVACVSPEKKGELQSLYMLLRLCTVCGEIGLDDHMLALARDIYNGASKADDEVFQIESLRILAEHTPASERERWREELDRLEETTDYVRYRRGGKPATPNPVLERLYGELGEFLSN